DVRSANAELQEWKDALARLIATSLDGAGPLRVSSVSGPFSKRPSVSERDSAAAIGRRTGAGFVIWGTVLDQGPQMVRVNARVLDVAAGGGVGGGDHPAAGSG